MSQEEDVKRLAELRDLLEKRIHNLESELEGLKIILEFVNEALLEKSFRRPELPSLSKETAKSETPPPTGTLKTLTGEILAEIYEDGNSLRIVLSKNFNVNTPPFRSFLVDRVLNKMREKDLRMVDEGGLLPDETFSYEIKMDGDFIREIIMKNVAPERKRELKSAVRWTLEKMFEKTRK